MRVGSALCKSLALTALVLLGSTVAIAPASAAPPVQVSVAGDFNDEVGCPGDWDPGCPQIQLAARPDGTWSGTFTIPAGTWEYKFAIDGSLAENYGPGGVLNGLVNFSFTTAASGPVTFYFDPTTHFAGRSGDVMAVAVGDFQSELGCPGDWQPDCLMSWLQDLDGDGTYTFVTTALPTGDYSAKATHDLSLVENYGVGGVLNGPELLFSTTTGTVVTFSYVLATHVLTITVGSAAAPGGPGGGPGTLGDTGVESAGLVVLAIALIIGGVLLTRRGQPFPQEPA
jgi:hypothetical protein